MKTIDPLGPLNIEEWKKDFRPHFPSFPPGELGDIEHLCVLEQVREQALGEMSSNEFRPMDMFVLAYGEPSRRDVTKIGGVPYRPSDSPWPLSPRTGQPLTFLAQFRFTESTDLVGPLPADVLLMFFEDFDDVSAFHFEWHELGIPESQLVTAESVPDSSRQVPVCHGIRCRYGDSINEGELDAIWQFLVDTWPQMETYSCSESDRRAALRAWAGQLCVFKIGGVPYWAQPLKALVDHANVGRFLGMIAPFGASENKRSWIWEGLQPDNNSKCDGNLYLGNETCLHLYLEDNDDVTARFVTLEPW